MTDTNPSPSKPRNFKLWEGSSSFIEQGNHWSSSFIWISSALFTSLIIWASTAKLDQTISVRGTLVPESSIRDVDSPASGVIKSLFINEGELVNTGDALVSFQQDDLISRKDVIRERLKLIEYELLALNTIVQSPSVDSIVIPNIYSSDLSSSPADLIGKLQNALDKTQQIVSQLKQLTIRLESKKVSLSLKESIAQDLKPLYDSGGLARNSYLQQLNQLQELRSDIAALNTEFVRLRASVLSKINELNTLKSSLESEYVTIQQQLSYRTLYAPISGEVFDLKVSPSSVVSATSTILKIVPGTKLSANVSIPNSDIGFVKVGQSVSISVDSFPSGEFGYISGSLISIGSDALPPDSKSQQVYFPAVISLKEQSVLSGTNQLNLQSGMSITGNIKLRSRPAISIITDIFTKQLDGVKQFR